MAVRIRLTRVGATKRPSYRVVAIEKQRARDGRALEVLGFYDPLTEPATVKLDADRIQAWISKGAQPSETVVKLMRQAEKGPVEKGPVTETPGKPKPAARARKPKERAAEGAKPEAQTPKPRAEATAEAATPEAEATGVPDAKAEAEPDAKAEAEPDAKAEAEVEA